MAGVRFLNPYLKVVICFIGMSLMVYFLYLDILAGHLYDIAIIGRVLLFVGFVYLLVKTVKQIIGRQSNN